MLLLVGRVLFVSLHAVSEIGITGLLGAKLASFSDQHDHGVAYMLYLMTFAFDSVGDVCSLAPIAAGLLVMRRGVLPRWLAWVSILAGILCFLQGFSLGGVIAMFGLVLEPARPSLPPLRHRLGWLRDDQPHRAGARVPACY